MSTVRTGWLNDKSGNKFAPKTLSSQVQTPDGVLLEDKIAEDIVVLKDTIDAEINELVNNISNKDHDHVADDITDLQEKFDNLSDELYRVAAEEAKEAAVKAKTEIFEAIGDFGTKTQIIIHTWGG